MVLPKTSIEVVNVLHFTIDGNGARNGDRTPAIFINEKNMILFRSNIDTGKYFSIDHPIPLNQMINVKMQQTFENTNTFTRIFVDGKEIYENIHRWTIPFENVKCYFGDPWYNPAPVRISNLRYTQQLLYPGKFSFLSDLYLQHVCIKKNLTMASNFFLKSDLALKYTGCSRKKVSMSSMSRTNIFVYTPAVY